MATMHFENGSQWRRWDLHIHAPGTKLSNAYKCKGDVWEKFISELEKSPVTVFGITDYFSADGYFNLKQKYSKKYPDTRKIFFPNIEFRLSETISKIGDNPHIHIIFDNDENNCNEEKIRNFLVNVKTSVTNKNDAKLSCSELTSEKHYQSATVSLNELTKSLSEIFGRSKPYLIVFPASNNGVRSTAINSPRKETISDNILKQTNLFFGNAENRKWFLSEEGRKIGKPGPKPVVSGSDAHSFEDLERLYGNHANFEPTWIKADLTFGGLNQICFEPESRIWIGFEPEIETRKISQSTKFLTRLKINQQVEYDESNGRWFKNVNIPLNPELIVIIGNKGSGKSALVDIIGLLGNSRQEEYFSFLSNKPLNKKFKQSGYAENFFGELTWQHDKLVSKKLDEDINRELPESVRYLPQNHFENLTNEIEINAFRRKIEDVVFSHVDETERMGQETFEKLQDYKTTQSRSETSTLKASLRRMNIEIDNLEVQQDPQYKLTLQNLLIEKQEELKALKNNRPQEIKKPAKASKEQVSLNTELNQLSNRNISWESQKEELTKDLTRRNTRLHKLRDLKQRVLSLESQIDNRISELLSICQDLELDINQIFTRKFELEPIDEKIAEENQQISLMTSRSDLGLESLVDNSHLNSLPDLNAIIDRCEQEINKLKTKLGAPQREYQQYLEKLAEWKTQKCAIIGEKDTPNSGTINDLENKIRFIDTELNEILKRKQESRKELVSNIYKSKQKILDFYSDLTESLNFQAKKIQTEDFEVEIEASFVVDRLFNNQILERINKNKRGNFYGNEASRRLLSSLMECIDWNRFESVYEFFDGILEKLSIYDGEYIQKGNQLSDTKEFYDFLFSMDYLSPKYELRLGGKNLNELSPGEKGLLLLVFYLQLDRDNIPLVIDQPEDNLDNESIFKVLANCIRQAKKKRQILLVTHNPNLAIGADAEQVIYVKLEKSNNYKFSYESGSIENPRINKRILEVLEGTQPAFVKRRLKYQI